MTEPFNPEIANSNMRSNDKTIATLTAERDCYRNALEEYAQFKNWNYHRYEFLPDDPRDWWQGDGNGNGNGYDLARVALAQGATLRLAHHKERDVRIREGQS